MNRISVIVPVYNDPEGIADTLSSILDIDYPVDQHEVLVVDNGSTDRTRAVAEEIAESADHVQVLVEDETQGSYAARNTGISRATGDLLAFVDADMTVEVSWLRDVTRVFKRLDCDYLGCDVELYLPGKRETIPGLFDLATGFPVKYYIEELNFAPTCCLIVRGHVVENLGGFRNDLVSGGDREFGQRVAEGGYDQQFTAETTLRHPARVTLGEHLSKARRLGRGRQQADVLCPGVAHGRPWYDPRNVLPPHPVRFRSRLHGNHGAGRLVTFFLLAYLLKLAQLEGQLRERLGHEYGGS